MTADGRRSVPTRRQLLAGLGTLGVASAFSGAATAALFTDQERVDGRMTAGELSLDVDCADCEIAEDRITLSLSDVTPGSTGRTSFAVIPRGNPGRLWVRTECPPVVDPLGETLSVTLWLDDDCDGEIDAETVLFTGTLSALRRELVDGQRLQLDTPCLIPDDPLCLGLEWSLPAEATWLADATTGLSVEFYAEQCRHVEETAVRSPFQNAFVCPELDCAGCVELGKIDVTDDRLYVGETYSFGDAGNEQYLDDGHEYALEVLTVTDKVDAERETVGAAFRLLRDGDEVGAPPICAVTIGGGKPNGRPSRPSSRGVDYDVDPPSTRTRGELYAAGGAFKDDPDSQPHDQRPAISNITVSVCGDAVEEIDD
jgi:predicted ribosomally synthesized peptide with SipW-like signal peptide